MPGSERDDEAHRPPPHPLDRPWIHPSELGASRSQAVREPERRPGSGRTWRRDAALAVTAGAIGALATVVVLAAVGAFDTEPRQAARTTSVSLSTDAAAVAARVAPGIVAVAATAGSAASRGSGIVVGPHEILTTRDVVAAAERTGTIAVSLRTGHAHPAHVRATDPFTGLVLLDVPGMRMEPARLGPTTDVRAGDWVVAVGRSATTDPWVTSGVVTATRGWTQDGNGDLHAGLINTSTAVSDDARGGALVDGRGRIVGILAMTGAGAPRAAAMPADLAADVVDQLSTTGRATHGALGVGAREAAPGPVVTQVVAGSSAARAGILVGDRVLAVDGTPTPDTATLVDELRRREAGSAARITVQRARRRLTVTATLDDAAGSSTPSSGMAPVSLTVAGTG
jgi:S1-C subfamily serine protease